MIFERQGGRLRGFGGVFRVGERGAKSRRLRRRVARRRRRLLERRFRLRLARRQRRCETFNLRVCGFALGSKRLYERQRFLHLRLLRLERALEERRLLLRTRRSVRGVRLGGVEFGRERRGVRLLGRELIAKVVQLGGVGVRGGKRRECRRQALDFGVGGFALGSKRLNLRETILHLHLLHFERAFGRLRASLRASKRRFRRDEFFARVGELGARFGGVLVRLRRRRSLRASSRDAKRLHEIRHLSFEDAHLLRAFRLER